jgi:protein-S-isoprenylcysteine O-methyltransferase Ste14
VSEQSSRRPLLFAWLGTFVLAGMLLEALILPGGPGRALRVAGAVLVFAALVLIIPPFAQLRRHGDAPSGASYMETARVADRGLYAMVRHPQYLGYMLLAAGLALRAQNLAMALAGLAAVVLFFIHSQAEERDCAARFGGVWQRYAAEVPGFNLPLGLLRAWRRRRSGAGT